MGFSTTIIPFFTDNIVIDVHSATNEQHLKRMSIAEFANGRPVSLQQRDDNHEYLVVVRTPDNNREFIEGPEYLD